MIQKIAAHVIANPSFTGIVFAMEKLMVDRALADFAHVPPKQNKRKELSSRFSQSLRQSYTMQLQIKRIAI